ATLTGAGNIEVTTGFTWTGGTISGSGLVTVDHPVSWTVNGGILSGRTLRNHGACALSGSSLQMTSAAAFRNQRDGSFDIGSDAGITGATSTFENQAGAMFRKSAGGGTSTVGSIFTSAGNVRLLSGTLRFQGASGNSSSGAATTSGGTTLEIREPFTFPAGAS